MKIVFKGWDDIDKIIQKSLTPFFYNQNGIFSILVLI